MHFLIDPEFGNLTGDNLIEGEDDEFDENACYNWVNHPIRKLYDNPRNTYHPSYMDEPEYEDESP